MAFLPNNIRFNKMKSNKSKVEKTLHVNLTRDDLYEIINKYANASYTHIIISIEPSNEFINGKYTTRFTAMVLTTIFDITITKVIDEFKKLLACHMQKR